ncbi:hypothetical protein FNU3_112 [Fusobacterium phage vB_FnuS_FNU3]|uniref:Uncharacterized protein n=1 Tax=Fusobacterium phage Fnu1 TaxID=2530024 RepID=A0A481W6R5_9CAUD|nr:hypothetical protein KMD24_gp095 [Fusobacterium phage Fnu1]QBJ04081.1 hypothetical protein [Fusobacterium phage Fnu1]WGH50210.1 hypothetical protein FNU2_17 [Fusobacterium phage vB_FnuS_FNU2]WGH50358.1 hypothetical protein FNU3_112 [Fusobacterium phage vB_FnuS_FNU3]
MKDCQKYLFKDNQNIQSLLEELNIIDKVVFKLDDTTKITRFLQILKIVYKKRKDKELVEPKHQVYISNQSIGWTDTYALVDQNLDIVNLNLNTDIKYWINLDFISQMKLDRKDSYVGILVTEDCVVFVTNNYCVLCPKEDNPMELLVDKLLVSSRAFTDTQTIGITTKSLAGFKELKTISQAFKSDIIDLYRVTNVPNSFYLTLNYDNLVAYMSIQNCSEDRHIKIDSTLIRIAFGTDSLVNIDKTNPSLVAHYDMNILEWILNSLIGKTLTLRIANASMTSQLVFDLDDFMILLMPCQ